MCDSTISVICFYNGKFERTEKYVKYVGNKAIIVPFDVMIDCTFDQLLAMIYLRTCIDKERFKSVITCKYPLKSINRFQPGPIWDDNSVYRMLKLVDTICDAPNPGCPLTTRQPEENLYVSYH